MAVAHFRHHSHASSSRARLSLQTIFSHNPLHRAHKSSSNMYSTSTAPSSVISSPSSSSSSFNARQRTQLPQQHVEHHMALSPSSPSSERSYVRRQPSAIDLALQEEQFAGEAEILGLGLLEPRPRANTASTISSPQCSMTEFMNETMQTPVVLDGIFEVLERA